LSHKPPSCDACASHEHSSSLEAFSETGRPAYSSPAHPSPSRGNYQLYTLLSVSGVTIENPPSGYTPFCQDNLYIFGARGYPLPPSAQTTCALCNAKGPRIPRRGLFGHSEHGYCLIIHRAVSDAPNPSKLKTGGMPYPVLYERDYSWKNQAYCSWYRSTCFVWVSPKKNA
jgi:hypothetical protein